ncbi:MAG: oligosaccharide flippase family protein [Pseudomonadota bacterium]
MRSLASTATRGAAWTIAAGLLSRGVGVIGTLVITRYLATDVMGEVTAATVLAFTANWVTQLGFTQYVLVRGEDGPDPIFHVTVISLTLATLVLGAMALAGPLLADWLHAPHLHEYLPGMALAVLIRRIGSTPDKLLLRRMRFRMVATATAAGELCYSALAVTLVVTTTLGGHSIIIANIVQACVITGITAWACGWRDWLTPVRLRWERCREILTFGLPLGVETFLYEAARYGDKLVFARLFGPARTGEYSLAYNLADIPATQVGEQVSNVLLPTLLRVDGDRRKQVLVRAIAMLSLITFPMAVGLAAIAPTLIDVLLPARWQGVAPFLVILAGVSMVRPINGLISQYLVSVGMMRQLMRLEFVRVVALFGGLVLLGQVGPIAAAFAVGLASIVHSCLLVRQVHGHGGFLRSLLTAVRLPVVASAAMAAAVLACRMYFDRAGNPHEAVQLVVEMAVGACTYGLALFVFGRDETREVIAIVRRAMQPKQLQESNG